MTKTLRTLSDKIDLKGWFALAWAVVFGLVYLKMVLDARAPGLLSTVRRWISR